jgi:hypothetical protein
MSTLSAGRAVEFDDLATTYGEGSNTVPISRADASSGYSGSAEIVRLPQFPSFSYPSNNVVTPLTRLAARMNASTTTGADHKQLLAERQELLDKELAKTLTQEESNRLKYVRWSLDRVDDARYGAGIEQLESLVQQYERFQHDIEKFRGELESLRKSSGGRR